MPSAAPPTARHGSPSTPIGTSRVGALILATLGGLITEAAFPGRSWWPLAYAGLALLLLALRRDSVLWGWFTAFAWGLGFFLPHLWWANAAVGEPIGWIALSIAQAGLVGLFGIGVVLVRRVRWIHRRPWAWAIAMAALWVAVEMLRSRWPFGGLPWGTLAFSQTDAPLVRLASLGSTALVSAAVVLIAAALVGTADHVARRQLLPAGLALLVAAVVTTAPGLLPLAGQAQSGHLTIGAVQGNVPQAGAEATSQARGVTANHAAGTHALLEEVEPGELDLVLWPESSADIDPRSDAELAGVVSEAADAVEAPIMLGTQRVLEDPNAPADAPDPRVRYNEIITWEPGTGPVQDLVYAKQLPVPFGEYMPYRDFFRMFTEAVDLVSVDMLAGSDPGILHVPLPGADEPVPIGVGICFEVAYDRIIREGVTEGGQFIVIPTNNASFDQTDLSAQQLAMSRFRAVEHGRTVIQVSTMGLSGIIAPTGQFQDSTALWTAEQMVAEVPLRTSLTPAAVLGPWPGAVLAAVGVLAAMAGLVTTVRHRSPTRARPARTQPAPWSGAAPSVPGGAADNGRRRRAPAEAMER